MIVPGSAIALRGVHLRYSGAEHAALHDVDLTFAPNTTTAILGPSGSGKSSILRLIAGLAEPDRGQVLIDGEDQSGIAPERRGVGMVLQRPLLFPHLSVIDNVAFSPRAAGVSKKTSRAEAASFLDLVALDGFGMRRPHEISGGQQQRVALARALISRPRALLLDEPFSALDEGLRDDMHALLRQLHGEFAMTVVFVTHDRREAADAASRLALIDDGRILQHGDVEEVFHRPQSLTVAQLMGGRNAIPGCIDHGHHRSSLGAVPVGSSHVDGPGILVVRQELVRVFPLSRDVTGVQFEGDVTAVQQSGARALISVRCGGQIVVGESDERSGYATGQRVRVAFSPADAWVVP